MWHSMSFGQFWNLVPKFFLNHQNLGFVSFRPFYNLVNFSKKSYWNLHHVFSLEVHPSGLWRFLDTPKFILPKAAFPEYQFLEWFFTNSFSQIYFPEWLVFLDIHFSNPFSRICSFPEYHFLKFNTQVQGSDIPKYAPKYSLKNDETCFNDTECPIIFLILKAPSSTQKILNSITSLMTDELDIQKNNHSTRIFSHFGKLL